MRRWLAIARQHPLMSLGFALTLIAVLFFATGFVRKTVYWMDPAHHAQPLEGWMTPRYIAHSWDIDGRALARHIGLAEQAEKPSTLQDIAEMRNLPLAEVISLAEAFLAEHAQPR